MAARPHPGQLTLWTAAVTAPEPVEPAPPGEGVVELAARLPPGVRLGTSSWAFPGWAGLVYARDHPQELLAREGLRAYARHPLLGCVGLDRTYYGPVPVEQLQAWAGQVPAAFRFVAKGWEEVTLPAFPDHPRYGRRAGQPNPRFLDATVFRDEVLAPLVAGLGPLLGAVVLEFSPMDPARVNGPVGFATQLGRFLAAAAAPVPVSVELRNPELLTPEYVTALQETGSGHVCNRWSRMPPLARQWAVTGLPGRGPVILRLLLPPGRTYAERLAQCTPFAQLVDTDPSMRDDVEALVRAALAAGREVLVVVNNKAEGSAPRTVEALARRLVGGGVDARAPVGK
ncbi:MAG: DUF72 domain-containing protein [Deltaproteobacteria bacterium]|nr:DUF72 domain-containing protein [Deltaproteobacteria bacterium]